MMLEISSASFKRLVIFSLSISIVSLIRHSQYLVSFADFNAITKNFFQSFYALPARLSMILAPIEVPLLINLSNIDK